MSSKNDQGISLTLAHFSSPQVDRAGDYVYRIAQPNRALGRLPGIEVVEFSTLSRHRLRLLLEADVLIINLVGDPDLLPIIAERKTARKLTIYEINDYFPGFQPWNPVYYFFKDPENRAIILQLIGTCDAVQVTCRELARRFERYNPNISVFENQMERIGSLKKPDTPFLVGWGGSHGHLEDMKRIAPHLIGWFRKHPEACLSIMGSREIFDLFCDLDEGQKAYTPPGTLDDFYRFIQTLHVGLAPLLPTDYNLCRSDVKFLEYGAFGAVPVCADLEPYHHVIDGETGFLFRTPEELPPLLDRITEDPDLRRRVAARAHDYVQSERMESLHAAERLSFYVEEGRRLDPDGRSGHRIEWIAEIPEARREEKSGYIPLGFTTVEKDLYNGLVHQFQHQKVTEAVKCFKSARAAAPGFYLPNLYLGNALEDSSPEKAEAAYREALTCNPSSCFTAALLGRVRQKQGKHNEALEAFRESARIAPRYARAWMSLALAVQSTGDVSAALANLQHSLEANPYYSPSYTHLGLLLLQQKRRGDARKAFECALALHPESVADNFYLGNILLDDGELEAAERLYHQALTLHPELAAAYVNLSRIYHAQGRSDEAEAARAEALRLQPDLMGKI
ncbi:MAG: tetratricopeptide repeat protein [Deltaproteobacteria bacterium]|nr:tetratricopeptide repeat protein [Deltaproteobacteria bacterium]